MYGLNYLGFFIPFVGFGSSHGALRYAAIENEPDEKQKIIAYSFSYGLNLKLLFPHFFSFLFLLREVFHLL